MTMTNRPGTKPPDRPTRTDPETPVVQADRNGDDLTVPIDEIDHVGAAAVGGSPSAASSSTTGSSAGRAPWARRNKALVIGLAAVVLASGAGWVAGRQIKSPAEIAARTAPPKASLITAGVERRVLTSDAVVRGTVHYGAPQSVTLPRSAFKAGVGIATTAPTKGASLSEGQLAMTVSGRPVFVLQGAQPMSRDLGPGATGTDVRQLEEALARMGYHPGAVDGTYDSSTAAAVTSWYKNSGWESFGPTAEQLAALRTAQSDQFGAQSEEATANENLVSTRSAQASADASVVRATSSLDAALSAQRAANLQLSVATAPRTTTTAPDGTFPAAITPGEIAALEAAVIVANAQVGVAQADLAAAKVDVLNAQAAVSAATNKSNLIGGRASKLNRVTRDLQAQQGVMVPADEVLFLGNLPLRVDEVAITIGAEVTGPVMTVSNSALLVEGALSANDAKLVRVGAVAVIDDPDTSTHDEGSVTEVADTPGTHKVDPGRFYLQVTPRDIPITLLGKSVVLNITVKSTDSDVLAVPVSSLSVAADGSSRLQVQDARTKRIRYVMVRPGLAAKGLVAVTPVKGDLAVGDLVVVGSSK